jgi:hypothetical protein
LKFESLGIALVLCLKFHDTGAEAVNLGLWSRAIGWEAQ